MVSMREAAIDDFEGLVSLFQQLQPKVNIDKERVRSFYEEMISSDKHFGWIAIENGKIVGYIDVVLRTYHFSFEFVARIETTIVDEKHRRSGIATELVKKCEDKAREMGCKVIELDSMLDREAAHTFYESCGYRKRGYLFSKKI